MFTLRLMLGLWLDLVIFSRSKLGDQWSDIAISGGTELKFSGDIAGGLTNSFQ